MSVTSLVIFFTILFTLVIIHELGHFLFAKWTKMRVDEFAFGFPPRLFSRLYKGTEYSFNLIPLGGYVKIFGENGLTKEELSGLSEEERKSLFGNKKVWQRLLVLFGGIIFNILGAVFLFAFAFIYGTTVLISESDFSKVQDKKLIVLGVSEKSSLYGKDIVGGDQIVSVFTKQGRIENIQDVRSKAVRAFIEQNVDAEISLKLLSSNGKEKTISGIPKAGIVEGKKILGIEFADIGYMKLGFFEALNKSIETTFDQTKIIIFGLYEFINGLIYKDTKVEDNLSGPIGLAMMTGKVSEKGWDKIFMFAAMLSLSLAIFNALPFPALDGGRIVFVVLEGITRRKIPANIEQIFHAVGFISLLALMIFVSYFDVVKAIAL